MATTQPHAEVTHRAGLVAALLEPLLDAGTSPALAEFDRVVADAVASGRLTPQLAHELRFWNRAATREVTDHLSTVLPAVLPVALAAIAQADDDAAAASEAAAAVWRSRNADSRQTDERQTDERQTDGTEAKAPRLDLPAAQPTTEDAPHHHARRRMFVAGLTNTA